MDEALCKHTRWQIEITVNNFEDLFPVITAKVRCDNCDETWNFIVDDYCRKLAGVPDYIYSMTNEYIAMVKGIGVD